MDRERERGDVVSERVRGAVGRERERGRRQERKRKRKGESW